MAGVRLVTDSSCDLPQEVVDELDITVVPLSIRFGEEELTDREELSAAEFYKRMADFEGLPETAAPSPGAFEAAFRAQAEAGADAVVCVNLSAALSATMASAQNGARALEGEVDVRVVDSTSITSGLGTLVTLAAEAARDGASADEVVALVERTRDPRPGVRGPRHPREPEEGRPHRRGPGHAGHPALDQAGHRHQHRGGRGVRQGPDPAQADAVPPRQGPGGRERWST